jgi:hypothetical protein
VDRFDLAGSTIVFSLHIIIHSLVGSLIFVSTSSTTLSFHLERRRHHPTLAIFRSSSSHIIDAIVESQRTPYTPNTSTRNIEIHIDIDIEIIDHVYPSPIVSLPVHPT